MLYRFRRSPLLWWSAVVAIAIVSGIAAQSFVASADAKAKRFGDTVAVFVANHDIEAGIKLSVADVSRRKIPRAFVPHGASITTPVDHAALTTLSQGEIIVTTHIAPTGLQGAAALLPEGHRAVAIPASTGTPELHVGDTVDVVVAFNTGTPESDSTPALTVAQRATVLALDENKVTIAVLPAESERVTYGLANGIISLVLTPRS